MDRRAAQITGRVRPARMAVALLLAGALALAATGSRGTEVDWEVCRPVAVRVEDGRALCVVPTGGPSDRFLVVVSCLARGDGRWPIQLRASRAEPSEPGATLAIEDEIRPIPAPGCRPPVSPPPDAPPPGALRAFHVMVGPGDPADPRQYRLIRGALRAFGTRLQVYVDERDQGRVEEETVRDLLETFEARVYPTSAGLWGAAEDIDGDGRFTVLLTSRLDRLGHGRDAVDGLFRGADMVKTLGAPLSNGCDMIYLNARLGAGPHLRTVLAHEYAHAVTFSRKSLPGPERGLRPEEEGWLDEAIAHLVEDLHGFSRSNLDHRVAAFLERPEEYALVVPDYYRADLFRSDGHRGSTYLFLRWCVDRFGPGLLSALIASEHRGVANLEAATGHRFDELYRRWSVSLYLDSIRPGCGDPGVAVAGPEARPIELDGDGDTWRSASTASRYALVDGSATGAIRIEVAGPAEANLQVTIVKLPPRTQAPMARREPGRGGNDRPTR